jgi:hypothetical protein
MVTPRNSVKTKTYFYINKKYFSISV